MCARQCCPEMPVSWLHTQCPPSASRWKERHLAEQSVSQPRTPSRARGDSGRQYSWSRQETSLRHHQLANFQKFRNGIRYLCWKGSEKCRIPRHSAKCPRRKLPDDWGHSHAGILFTPLHINLRPRKSAWVACFPRGVPRSQTGIAEQALPLC